MVLCCKMLEFLNGDAQMRDFVEPFRKRYSPQHRVENIFQQSGPLIETFMHYSLFNFNLTNCSSTRITRNLNNRPRGGYSEFQVTGMIEWGQKSIPKKIPRASNKTPKNPWTKNLPQKNPMPKFRALISRKD